VSKTRSDKKLLPKKLQLKLKPLTNFIRVKISSCPFGSFRSVQGPSVEENSLRLYLPAKSTAPNNRMNGGLLSSYVPEDAICLVPRLHEQHQHYHEREHRQRRKKALSDAR
jgi:hypothetical protein